MLALRVQVDVDIATHIDVYDDGPDRRYAYLSYCFIGFVMHRDTSLRSYGKGRHTSML